MHLNESIYVWIDPAAYNESSEVIDSLLHVTF